MSIYPPGAIFCRTCGYCLYGLTVNRCPECGHEFDPADPKTFRDRPPRVWLRSIVRWSVRAALLLAVLYGGLLGWLYWGWKAEAPARGLPTGPYGPAQTRPILPTYLSCLLVGGCRQWQERVDRLEVVARQLSPEQLRALAACRYLRVLSLYGVVLSGEDLAVVCRCRDLEELDLARTGVRNADVALLANLNRLKALGLDGNFDLDDRALESIAKLSDLQGLYLQGAGVTDAGVSRLAGLASLEELALDGCFNLTDAAVPHLARLTSLKRLHLGGTSLSRGGIAQLRVALPQCTISDW